MRKIAFLALMLMMMTFPGCDIQNTFIYFPDTVMPSEKLLAAKGLKFWQRSGDDYRGLIGSKEVKAAKGTVIVFHGNAGRAADREFYADMLGPLGYRVILAEYPGYGGRRGVPGEKVFVRDASESLRVAFEKYGGPVYLMGESLGCGVTAAVAGAAPVPVEGVVLITPWDSLPSVARSKVPGFLVKLLLKDRYDSISNLRSFRKKIAIVGAERDDIIPVRHAEALYDSLPGEKRMWTIKGAGHNDWPVIIGEARFREIMDFVSK